MWKPNDHFVIDGGDCDIRLENADIQSNIESKVPYLEMCQQNDYFFREEPGRTDLICHGVWGGQARHIKHKLNLRD